MARPVYHHQTGPDDSPTGPVADMANRTCKIETCPDQASRLGWCNAHYRRWRRHGDPEAGPKTYHFDETFFDVIDTEAKAYWLGFIAADGCIRTDHSSHQVRVKLMVSDAPHLEKLKAALSADYLIKTGERRGVAGAWAALTVSSPHMVDALAAVGVTPRKSLTAQPWDGPAHLMRHYWRGLFDGDGYIGRETARNKWTLNLCGSGACVASFADWAREICGATSRPYLMGSIWRWKVSGLSAPQALARGLYGNATVYLDRKQELALDLLAQVPVRDLSQRTEYCTEEGCTEKTDSLNRCTYHYQKNYRRIRKAEKAAKQPE